MRKLNMLMISVAVVTLSTQVFAADLVINPFPNAAPAAKSAPAPADQTITPAPLAPDEISISSPSARPENAPGRMARPEPVLKPAPQKSASGLPVGIQVPDPGSDYFASPSSVKASPAVQPVAVPPPAPQPVMQNAQAPQRPEPQGEIYSQAPRPPVAARATAEPLSVSASEFMELDPDIVETPLGRPGRAAQAAPVSAPILEPAPSAAPQPLAIVSDPLQEPPQEVRAVQAVEVGQVAQPPMNQPMSDATTQKHNGLVYIRDGEILNAPPAAAPTPLQPEAPVQGREEIVWAEPAASVAPAASATGAVSEQWSAQNGASVPDTLARWSSQADVQFFWEGDTGSFPVINPVSLNGTYEAAVQALLDQYQDAKARPIAQLHENPQTYQRVLVVRVVQGG